MGAATGISETGYTRKHANPLTATRCPNKWAHKKKSDLADLAAAYGFGLATSHPYRDGNKRIAFLTILIFLGLNGYSLSAPETEVVTTMLAIADHRLSAEELAGWVRR